MNSGGHDTDAACARPAGQQEGAVDVDEQLWMETASARVVREPGRGAGAGVVIEMSLRFGVEGHARRASPKPVGFSVMMLEKRRSCPSRKPVSSPATARQPRVVMAARAVNPGAGGAGKFMGERTGATPKGRERGVHQTRYGSPCPHPSQEKRR
jgi:hypothetical protein